MAEPRHVLIIEDDPMICELLVAFLDDRYRVTVASEGESGIQLAIQEQPDVILCDVLMPRMHGPQVLRRLKAEAATSHIPVVLMSGHGDPVEDDGGHAAFLQKPFEPGEVFAAIEQAFLAGDESCGDPG